MAEDEAQLSPPESLLQLIDNLARFHREHEEYYSQAPLRQAGELQARSRALKTLADRWSVVGVGEQTSAAAFAGTEDLNAPGLAAASGILFMEGEGEPVELQRLKREVGLLADDVEQTGAWLAGAMEQAWEIAGGLAAYPALVDLLGERHRIIANDWQSAGLQALVARLLRRALDLLACIDFAPAALRVDLGGERTAPAYLYSASELLDRAADLMTESATLVHDNERRWRIFRARVRELQST
ncbi:hypothetical protein BN159_0620 [Streptomyces davaonensis JCM 4913]|uniref:Uncharacterized protein n=1 Tax=Streptomyces davaonensis (strain DSM 101723 / JCM 4913 / KCC S-0913 / 768) TaxID=1214101 RepID=K4QX97_STRDJ|nr:hypothetical protein [Streptomyces davaonensis]CCK24999.1 hypothetical protein BN159_0620 [Streptomyces davaonensis JCM 4913]